MYAEGVWRSQSGVVIIKQENGDYAIGDTYADTINYLD